MPDLALAPIPPPDASVHVPGSKSLTNRALVCAALAAGPTRLTNWLHSEDTAAMREGLARLGVEIQEQNGDLVVNGVGGRFAIPLHPIDCKASGTTMRFLTACAALVEGRVVLDGTQRMRERPIQDLADALQGLGVNIRTSAGCPPVTVYGGVLQGGDVMIDARSSSQFLSALLMIAPFASRDVVISTDRITSRPYVDMTLDVMSAFGVSVSTPYAGRFEIAADQHYRARGAYAIEPDATAATYFFAAAAVTRGRVRVEGLSPASNQSDVRFVEILASMGCSVERGPNWLSVRGQRYLHGVDVDMNGMPDGALTLAVVACFAHGTTRIRGVENLRIKESDRLAALQAELQKLGAQVQIDGGNLEIVPPEQVRGARIATYGDHRIAMSFAVAGLAVPGIVIEDPDCVAKTFPDFFHRLKQLG